MSVLSAKDRARIPKAKMGLPKKGKYPMPDDEHAVNAKARATQQYKKGNLSSKQLHQIRAKANRILGHKSTGAHHGLRRAA